MAVARAGGAAPLLHFGPKRTREIELKLHLGSSGYEALLEAADDGALFFGDERYRMTGTGSRRPVVIGLGAGHRETALPNEAR